MWNFMNFLDPYDIDFTGSCLVLDQSYNNYCLFFINVAIEYRIMAVTERMAPSKNNTAEATKEP